jgi:hypothetical protein
MDNRSRDIDTAAVGTCEWLPGHPTYKRWVASDRGLLWIKGKPGSGKSTLLRYALDNVMVASNIGTNAFVLSFFLHGRGVQLQKTPLGLLQSLLYQLLSRVPDELPDLIAAFQKHYNAFGEPGEKWQWHLRELQDLFESSLAKILEKRSVWLFVDALDESGKDNATELVNRFNSLVERLPPTRFQFRICFSCRPYPILYLDFTFEICLELENGDAIATYVKDRLSAFSVRNPSSIPTLIVDRAAGVFLWAFLVVNQVLEHERRGEGLAMIEAEIRSIPPELNALYHELAQGMTSASLKLIRWVCFAKRPLSLDELRWAMILDADCAHKSLRECQSNANFIHNNGAMELKLKTLSCGLTEAVPSSEKRVVQFIHQSVKDFFVEKGLSDLDHSPGVRLSTALIGIAIAALYLDYLSRGPQKLLPNHVLPLPTILAIFLGLWLHRTSDKTAETNLAVGTAHYQLSRTCIRYLAMEEINRTKKKESRDLVAEFPLLHYATTSWISHVQESETKNVCQDNLLDCFD